MIIHNFLSDAEIKEILNWRVIYFEGTTVSKSHQYKRVVDKASIDLQRTKFDWLKDKILNAVADYNNAISVLANKEAFNFNVLLTPGLIQNIPLLQ